MVIQWLIYLWQKLKKKTDHKPWRYFKFPMPCPIIFVFTSKSNENCKQPCRAVCRQSQHAAAVTPSTRFHFIGQCGQGQIRPNRPGSAVTRLFTYHFSYFKFQGFALQFLEWGNFLHFVKLGLVLFPCASLSMSVQPIIPYTAMEVLHIIIACGAAESASINVN